MSQRSALAAEHRHWFYDNKFLICAFCLASFMAITWQVSRFEGFQPIFNCESAKDIDQWLLSSGMAACMENARSRDDEERCLRTVYLLACMKERWR